MFIIISVMRVMPIIKRHFFVNRIFT